MEKGHFLNLMRTLLFKTEKESITLNTIFRQLDEWNLVWATSMITMIHEEYQVNIDGDDISLTETVDDLYQMMDLKRKIA